MSVQLPVVADLRIATRPVGSEIQIVKLSGGGEGSAVNQRADGVAVELAIDVDGEL